MLPPACSWLKLKEDKLRRKAKVRPQITSLKSRNEFWLNVLQTVRNKKCLDLVYNIILILAVSRLLYSQIDI